MERQAKDGTFYRQVGQDAWEPVTRTAKDGSVYQKVGADDWRPISSQQPAKDSGPSTGDKVRAGIEGFAESVSLGTLPYLKAAGEAATDFAAEKILGSEPSGSSYDDRVQKFREQGRSLQEKAPGYALAGQVTGFVLPGAAASKAVGAGLKAASGVSKIAGAAEAVANSGRARELYRAAEAAKSAGNLKRAETLVRAARADLGLQGARLAGEGALIGAAYTPESGFTDVGARVQGALVGAGTGAVMPATMRGAGNTLRAGRDTVSKAASSGGKKLLSSLGGVSEDVIDRYMKDPERIRNASTFDELYERVSGVVSKLQDDLDAKKVDFDTAKDHLKEVSATIKNSRIEGKSAALEEVRRAQISLDEAFKAQKQGLTSQASPSRIEPLVEDAMGNLRNRVVRGSNEAYDILGQQSGQVDLSKVLKSVRSIKDSMNIAGRGPATPQAKAAQNEINTLIETVGQLPARLSMVDAKQLVQQIDRAEKVVYGSGQFTDEVSRAFKALRGGLDDSLKEVKPYADKMAEVASDTRTLSAAQNQFGKDSSRLSRLANIGRETGRHDLETLRQLAGKEGGAMPGAVDSMVDAQKTLRSPIRMEGVKQRLPENEALRTAEMAAATTKKLAKPREIQRAIDRSAAFFKARSAEANFKSAKSISDKFKSFSEQGAESKLRQVAQGRKFATKTLSELSKLADEDFVQAVHAASDAAAFTKSAFNGSRNVNLWTVMGALGQMATGKGGAGAAGGFIFGGPVGMAFGAITGAMIDSYGPAITKKILDGISKAKGPITPRSIEAFDIPDSAKRDLINQFRSTVLVGRAAIESATASPPRAADNQERSYRNSDVALRRGSEE